VERGTVFCLPAFIPFTPRFGTLISRLDNISSLRTRLRVCRNTQTFCCGYVYLTRCTLPRTFLLDVLRRTFATLLVVALSTVALPDATRLLFVTVARCRTVFGRTFRRIRRTRGLPVERAIARFAFVNVPLVARAAFAIPF